jgi:hypothetical protein
MIGTERRAWWTNPDPESTFDSHESGLSFVAALLQALVESKPKVAVA